jgi:hypothetical protein
MARRRLPLAQLADVDLDRLRVGLAALPVGIAKK